MPYAKFDVEHSGFGEATRARKKDPSFGREFANAIPRGLGQTVQGVGQIAEDLGWEDNPVKRYGERVIQRNPTEINSLEDIADYPLAALGSATGNAAGFLASGGALGLAGKGLALAGAARAGGLVAGGVGQTANMALPSYGGIREQQLRDGNDSPVDMLAAAGGALTSGYIEQRFGLNKMFGLSSAPKTALRAEVGSMASTPLRTGLKEWGKAGVVEGLEELAQNPIEQIAAYKDPTTGENIQETLFGGAMGVLGGLGLGGYGGVRQGMRQANLRNDLRQDMFIAPDAGTPTDLLQGMDRREQYNQVQGAWQAQKDFDRPAPMQQPDEETAAYLEQRQQAAETETAKQTLRDNLVSKGVDPAKIEGIVLAAFQPKRTKAAATYTEEQQAIYESLPDTMTDKQKRRIVGKPGVVPVPSVSKVGKVEAMVMKEFDDAIAAGLVTPNEESTLRGYWDASEKKQGDAWKLRANIGALIKAKQGAKNGDGSKGVYAGGTPTDQTKNVLGGQAPSGGAQTAQAVSGAQGQEVNDDPARALGLKLLADMPVGKKNRQGKTEPVKFGPVLATFLGFDGQDDERFQAVADAHGYASRQRAEQIVKEAIPMLREVAARNGITVEQAIAAVQALAASRRTDLGMTEDQQEIAKLTGATEQAVESPYQGTMDFTDAASQGMLSSALRAQTDSGATQVGEGSDETTSGAPGKGTVAALKAEQEVDAATTVETAPGETRIKANKEKGEQYLTDTEIKAKRAAEALAKKDAKGGTLAVPEERGQQGKVKYKHNEFEYASAKEDYNDVVNELIQNGEEVTQWDALPQEYKDRITQAWKDATNPNVNRQLRGRVDLEALTAEYKRLEGDYIYEKTKSDKQDARQGAEAETESKVQDDNAGVPKQEASAQSVAAPKAQVQKVTGGIRSRFEDFLGVVIKRFAMEQEGQANLDEMVESNIKPQDVAKEFWANTFFDLPASAQQRFTQMLKANTGMEPGSTTTVNSATGTSVVAQNWQDVADMIDVGDTAENLEGTERGFVALMYEANKRANAFKAENKAEFTALESSPTKIERKAPVPLPSAEPPKATQAKATSVARTAKAAKPKSLTKEQKAAAGKVLLIQQMEVAWNDLAGENNLPVWSALNQDQRTRLMEDATPNSEGNAVRAVVAELTGETQEAPASTVPALELPAIDVDFIDVTDEEVAKATNLLPQLETALDKTLDESDKQEVTDHFGVEEEFGNATKKLFLKEYAKWLTSTNRALHELADIFVKVAKSTVNGILAIAIAFNFTATNPIPEANASVPVTKFFVTQTVNNPVANFNGVEAPLGVKMVADWQVRTNAGKRDTHKKSFIIGDKVGGLLYAFGKDGKLIAKAPALFGAATGDKVLAPEKSLDDFKKSDKITPAGVFSGKFGQSDEYGTVVRFADFNKFYLAIHRVYLGTPSERRIDRLNSEIGTDNRISYGCINVTNEFFDDVIAKHFAGDSTVVVMPETGTLEENLPGINEGITKQVEMTVGGKQDSAKEVSWGSDKYGRPEQRRASRSRARVTMDGSFLEPNDDVMHKDGRVGRVVSTRYRNPKINGLNTITVKFADGTTEGVTPDKLTYLRKPSVTFDGRKGTFGNESVNGGLRKIAKDDDIALEFDDRVGAVMVTGIDRISGGVSGRASNALKSLTDWADSTNNTLVLMPSASGALKKDDLKAWYARNGFVSAPDGAMVRKTDAQGTLFSKGDPEIGTSAFKRWFGGSKVVGENGEPLRVYHGTRKDFDAFDTSAGSFFTSRPNIASAYSAVYNNDSSISVEDSRVLPVYLSIKNPYITDNSDYMVLSPKDIAKLKAKGFDGVKITSNLKEGEWVVFDAAQVKSVFNENATGGNKFSKGQTNQGSTVSDDQSNPVYVRYAISTAFGLVRRASGQSEVQFITDAGVAAERGKADIAGEYSDSALEAFTKYIDKARKATAQYPEAQEAFGRLDDSIAAATSALQKAKAEPTKVNTEKAADALRSLNAAATEVEKQGTLFSKGDPELQANAARIKAMPESVRDNTEAANFPGGYRAYVLYEAQKMVPNPSEKLKRVNDNNSFALWQEMDYVANVNGVQYGVTKDEDPDEPDDDTKFVFSYERLDAPIGGSVTTITSDVGELLREIKKSQLNFSKGASAKGSTVAELTTLLKGYFHAPAFFNRMVEVVQSSKDLPAAVRNDPEFDDTVKAVVHNGKAYIIADKVPANKALSILLHEVGVHLGMQKLLGGNYTRLIAQLKKWESKPGSLEHDLVKKARARVNAAGTSALDQDHELVAYFVEEAVNAGINPTDLAKSKGPIAEWIASLMKTLMSALKSVGMKNLDALTAQNIVDLAYGAANIQLSSATQPSTKKSNLYSFAGVNANQSNKTKSSYVQAVLMDANGESVKKIYDDTGWFKWDDGKWRFEISDKDMTLQKNGLFNIIVALAEDTSAPLGEVINHKKLFAAYPELRREIAVRPSADIPPGGASIDERRNVIEISKEDFDNILRATPNSPRMAKLTTELLKSLAHEIQHAIQVKEGFSGGGNSDHPAQLVHSKAATEKLLRSIKEQAEIIGSFKRLVPRLQYILDHFAESKEVVRRYLKSNATAQDETAFLRGLFGEPLRLTQTLANDYNDIMVHRYYRLAGEAEARDVSNRMEFPNSIRQPALMDDELYIPTTPNFPSLKFSKGNASTIPKAVEFTNDTVANMLSRVKVTAADLGSKALNAAVFMNDLIKIAEKAGLTAAKGFNDLMGERDQIRNRGEERISAIMSRASKLKDQSAVEQFLRDSTIDKKYGYGPKSDNGEYARRFTQLSAEGQAVVKDVFQVGEDNYTEMQRLAAVEVNREYNALIARFPKKTAELEKERTKELARLVRVMPKLDGPYAPLKRFGDHVVVARSNEYAQAEAAGDRKKMDALIASPNDNNYLVEFYDTAGAADARKAQLVSYFDKVVSSNRQENFHKVDGLPWSGIEKIKSAVEDSPDAKYKESMNRLLTNLYLKMLAESSARKSELKRRGVLGSGDMFRAFAANGRSNAHFIASMAKNPEIGRKIADMRQESKALREGGNVDATRAMNEILARYAQGLDYKETPWVDKALRVSSLWMLLTSPAYYLQNSTQTYMMTLPVLGGRYGGKAFTEITKAYGDVMKYVGNMGAELDVRKLPITKAEQDMLISLRDKGKLDITIASDMGRWASGAADQGVVGRAIDKMYGAAGKVEALNRITTALAAYRLSNGNEQYAGEIIDMTQGNYAATNAPRFFSATGATKLITQFRKYQLIQISLMGRLMYDSFKGASAQEKAFARRSLLWLFAQQGLLTGLKGLPIPAVIYMIAAALGGDDDDDWERNLRKWIGDEDIATLLIRGIPAYMGLDLSGRIGMGNAFSILPYSDIDFSKKGYKEAVFGATGAFIGGMGGQLFDGLEKMRKGNYYKGLEALAPRGLRDAMAGYRMGTEGVTSGKGDLLLSADEITAFDAAMKAVGLPTTRITEFQTSRGDLFELNNHFKERETALKNDYADAAKQRDSDAMSEAREEWKAIQASKGRWLAYLAGRGLGNKDLTKDLQPHPLGTLLKAPAAQMKRERPWQGAAAQRQAQ